MYRQPTTTRTGGVTSGDCVDLNTGNDFVAEYPVECYEKFIEMGVDGEDEEVRFFNLQGIEIKNPSRGLYIVKQGKCISKVLIK